MENLFLENTCYCYCEYKGKSDIVEIDLTKYPDVNSIIEHVKLTLRPIINDATIIIWANIDLKDYFITNNKQLTVDYLIDEPKFSEYINNWETIVDLFINEVCDDNVIFESDGFNCGEILFLYYPENEYSYEDAELTEEGWENISDYFVDSVNNIVVNYPITILDSLVSNYYDVDCEYERYKVSFDIEPYVNNTILL